MEEMPGAAGGGVAGSASALRSLCVKASGWSYVAPGRKADRPAVWVGQGNLTQSMPSLHNAFIHSTGIY